MMAPLMSLLTGFFGHFPHADTNQSIRQPQGSRALAAGYERSSRVRPENLRAFAADPQQPTD